MIRRAVLLLLPWLAVLDPAYVDQGKSGPG